MIQEKFVEEFNVRLPEPLKPKSIRDAIGIGLFYVGRLGKRPQTIPDCRGTTARIKLTREAKKMLDESISDFGSRNEFIITALAWIKEQPQRIQKTKI